MARVAYQGVAGSFSHLTAVNYFGKEHLFLGRESFEAVFEALKTKEAEYACLPIENSLIGSIYENYDLLGVHDFPLMGEAYTRIELCLLALPHTEMGQIKKVFSHPKALLQCQRFFAEHAGLEAVVHADTAGAAADIAQGKELSFAALASREAAAYYGLQVVKQNVEDDARNYTRFFFLSSQPQELSGNKSTLIFTLDHVPGALMRVLASFAEEGFNLTKTESRPLVGRPFEYLFYADLEGEGVPQQFTQHVKTAKILGQYKRGSL